MVAETLMLAAVSAMPLFFLSIVLKPTMDAVLFYARASFETISESPWSANTEGSVLVLPKFPVVPAPSAGESLAYTPRLTLVEVDLVDDVAGFVDQHFGSNRIAMAGGDGAVVDLDSAQSLGVGLGSEVVLDLPAIGGFEAPRATVVGIVQPYARPGDSRATGLVVFPVRNVSSTFAAEAARFLTVAAEPLDRRYDEGVGARRDDIAIAFLGEFLNAEMLAAVGGVALFGGLIWLAVSARVVGRAARRAARSAAILVAIGAQRRQVVAMTLALPAVQMVAGPTAGAALLAAVIHPFVLNSVLQPPVLLPPLLLCLALSGGVLQVAAAQAHRALASADLHRSLTTDQE